MNDALLWQRYCAGDAGAFDAVYARHRGALFRYVRRLCRDCPESEELYQDVWLRAIHARDAFHGEQFQAWLFRIAHNRLIDFFRAAGHAEEALDDDAEITDAQPLPERWSLLRDCVERLFAILRDLPRVQREAFLLKEETGLSLDEIGTVMAVGRETVKSRLRYALHRLRGALEGCDD